MKRKLISSPYSLLENLKWPILHAFPSMKRNYDYPLAPIHKKWFEAQGDTIRLLFFGDLMNMYGDIVPECCDSLKELFSTSDYVVGNLECPITSELKSGERLTSFRFKTSKEYLGEFCNKFSISPQKLLLSISNNHIGDFGSKGVEDTLRYLNELGINAVGLKGEKTVLNCLGKSLQLWAATEWMNHEYSGDHNQVSRISELISQEMESDFNVILPHWGREFRHFSDLFQHQLAQRLVENGANLIVGHHSHVPMNGELLGNVPCFYGLGNFVSIQYTYPTKMALVLEVNLTISESSELVLSDYTVHPYYFLNRQKVLPMSSLDDKLLKRCQKRMNKLFSGPVNDL